MAESSATSGADQALRVVLPHAYAEVAGAILMELLGPFELQGIADADNGAASPAAGGSLAEHAGEMAALVFYPAADARSLSGQVPTVADILAALPAAIRASGNVRLQSYDVSRDWVEGWRDHFRPILIGGVRIRPPWEAPLGSAGRPRSAPVDVVINPGLGFGTGLHPTTRGTLKLLQEGAGRSRGPLVDAGTGSGVLAIAAAKLGWMPVFAFDNDPFALQSARENITKNGVDGAVQVIEADVASSSSDWFAGATVLANMTLEPVTALLLKLAIAPAASSGDGPVTAGPQRLVVSGILAGDQEQQLLFAARECSFSPGRRAYEAEWVSLELFPAGA
jgi:ribosomal protein L11 methyltransferase